MNKAVEIKTDFYEAWNSRGWTLEKLERFDEALKSYEKALEIEPDFELAINNRRKLLAKLARDSSKNGL